MILMARSSIPTRSRSRRRSRRPVALLGVLSGVLSAPVVLAGPAAAAPVAAPVAAVVETPGSTAAPAAPPASVPVRSLAMTGTTTTITVRRVVRGGQVRWINHVLNTRLLDLDGCQARRTRASWDGWTYRTTVRTVCTDGPARSEAAVRRLVVDRPWYRVTTRRESLVGFGLLVDLPAGNDRAMPAALAKLPSGPFTFADGDDLSLNYVGQRVGQAQLDAAVTAFAGALAVPVSRVEVTPLATP